MGDSGCIVRTGEESDVVGDGPEPPTPRPPDSQREQAACWLSEIASGTSFRWFLKEERNAPSSLPHQSAPSLPQSLSGEQHSS